MVIGRLNGNDGFPYLLKRNLRTEAVEASDAAVARRCTSIYPKLRDTRFDVYHYYLIVSC